MGLLILIRGINQKRKNSELSAVLNSDWVLEYLWQNETSVVGGNRL